jgi:hypothetical protein
MNALASIWRDPGAAGRYDDVGRDFRWAEFVVFSSGPH